MTAATFVGLMSLPGLAVLYGGVMQKRWSVNSMMLTFVAFSLVLVAWCLWAFKMGFGTPIGQRQKLLRHVLGKPGSVLGHVAEQGQASIPSVTEGPPFHFPQSTLVYFQFVFAAITPILMLGSVLGRISFKAWIPFVLLWITFVYTINAFLIWGGGYFAAHGALDYSGGYVIHLAAGVSGFVAAAVIGPRLKRDREVDAPEQPADGGSRCGSAVARLERLQRRGLLLRRRERLGGRAQHEPGTAVAMLVWIGWDYIFRDKPSLIGSVNGMITGLVAITPSAGFINGYGAIIVGVVASTIVWMSIRFLSRAPIFRNVDDTLGVIYTHGIAGLTGGLLVGLLANTNIIEYIGEKGAGNLPDKGGLLINGSWTLLRWQAETALWVIVFSAVGTFILLKFVGIFLPLRLSDEELEIGDHAIHGNEVYPSDVPTLGGPHGAGWQTTPVSGEPAVGSAT